MHPGTFSISIAPAGKIILAPTLVEFTVAEVIIPQQTNTQKVHTLLIDCFSTAGNKPLSQSLWIGAGIKLPTGHYNAEEKNVLESSQNTFQLGTGSIDFSLHLLYDIRLQNAGININAGYKINTSNQYDYQYGNKLTTNLLAYYQIKAGKNSSFTPNTGVLFESSAKDKKAADLEIWETGGHSLMGTAGLECLAGRIGMGLNFQTSLSQQLGEGKVQAKNRGMAYISFSF